MPIIEEQTIGQDIRVLSGFPFASAHFSNESGMPLIRIRDLLPHHTDTCFQGLFDPEYIVQKGDILIGMDGDFNAVTWKGAEGVLNQRVCKVKTTNKRLNIRYLYHWLQPKLSEIHNQTPQTTVRHLSVRDIENIQLPYFDNREQEKVGTILDWTDQMIEQTESSIAKLHKLKDGLLHNLLTRGIGEDGKLRDPVAHPEQFKGSPLGLIPRNWIYCSVESLLMAKPKNGYSPKESSESTGMEMLGLGCLTINGFRPTQIKHAPLNDLQLTEALLEDGDLLISRSNTRELVGLVGTYRDIGLPCTYPDLMMRLKPNTKINGRFLEYILSSFYARSYLTRMASGTSGSMVKISAPIVISCPALLPSIPEQQKILESIEALEAYSANQERLLGKIQKVKSGLMHDLLTGTVRTTPLLKAA